MHNPMHVFVNSMYVITFITWKWVFCNFNSSRISKFSNENLKSKRTKEREREREREKRCWWRSRSRSVIERQKLTPTSFLPFLSFSLSHSLSLIIIPSFSIVLSFFLMLTFDSFSLSFSLFFSCLVSLVFLPNSLSVHLTPSLSTSFSASLFLHSFSSPGTVVSPLFLHFITASFSFFHPSVFSFPSY